MPRSDEVLELTPTLHLFQGGGRFQRWNEYAEQFEYWDLGSSTLEDMAQRLLWSASDLRETELREYNLRLIEAFKSAAREYPSISVDPNVMAGAPCIAGTRIPVYMILDAIEAGGGLESALTSYPRLTIQQVKDAVGFAKLVVESPIEHETTPTSR